MKRKDFIKLSILSSVGISASPLFSFVTDYSSGSKLIPLPPISNHVRHSGLNSDAFLSVYGLPDWISNIERHVFFENGYSISNKDLKSTLFSLDGTPVSVCAIEEKTELFINDLIISKEWSSSNYKIEVRFINKNELVTLPTSKGKLVVLPLSGSFLYMGHNYSDHILYSNTANEIAFHAATDFSFLIISKIK